MKDILKYVLIFLVGCGLGWVGMSIILECCK